MYSPSLTAASLPVSFPDCFPLQMPGMEAEDTVRCNWKHFRAHMLLQWRKLTVRELDEAGPSRGRVARLIACHYGIAIDLVENYLYNFEHAMLAS